MGIVSVSASGVVQAKKPGKATIKVLSIFYPFNYDEVVVEVSVPASMVILLNFPVETVVGTHLQAAVTMKASNVNEREVRRTAIQADCSSGRIRGTPVIVANGRTIRLAAIGISISGEAFANSSSLYLRWELISCNEMANWDDADNLERSEHGWERDNMGGHKSVPLLDSSENVLADGIQLVSTLMVSPEFNLVFFDPNAKVNYKAKGFQRTRQLMLIFLYSRVEEVKKGSVGA
ncbi:hypothetical protein GBA52_011807 [Prunus armeniaca]|nr:hypothetical protein GBA52_011807 [Prunus armeniaca]